MALRSSQSVYAVATMDTKGYELAYVAECLRQVGVSIVTVNVGTMEPPTVAPDIDRATVAGCHPGPEGRTAALSGSDRGQAIAAMGEGLEAFLRRETDSGRVSGVIGIGGSGGTAIMTQAMRRCRSVCPSSWSRRSPAATRPRTSAPATSR